MGEERCWASCSVSSSAKSVPKLPRSNGMANPTTLNRCIAMSVPTQVWLLDPGLNDRAGQRYCPKVKAADRGLLGQQPLHNDLSQPFSKFGRVAQLQHPPSTPAPSRETP